MRFADKHMDDSGCYWAYAHMSVRYQANLGEPEPRGRPRFGVVQSEVDRSRLLLVRAGNVAMGLSREATVLLGRLVVDFSRLAPDYHFGGAVFHLWASAADIAGIGCAWADEAGPD